jgi:hypothetical protein
MPPTDCILRAVVKYSAECVVISPGRFCNVPPAGMKYVERGIKAIK